MRQFSTGLGVVFCLLAPSWCHAQGQFGPGGFGGFGPGGFGGNAQSGPVLTGEPLLPSDAAANFNLLANGRNFFLVTEARRLRRPLDDFLQARGVVNGIVTKQLYMAFERERFLADSDPSTPGGGRGFQTVDSKRQLNQYAEMEFKRLDRNEDGQLSIDEMSSQLKEELSRWDANRDNLINFEEFKLFFNNRYQNRGKKGMEDITIERIIEDDEDLDIRPSVLRLGKLVLEELPEWWQELDVEPRDGQVSLYEWRQAGKPIEEFREWDRNDDGLITPDEAQHKMRLIMIARAKEKEDDDEETQATAPSVPAQKAKQSSLTTLILGGAAAASKTNWAGKGKANWGPANGPGNRQVDPRNRPYPATKDRPMEQQPGRRPKDQ